MSPELCAGLIIGVLLAGALGVLLATNPTGAGRRPRVPAPVVGIAVVLGSLLALASQRSVPKTLVVALGGIGLVCAIPRARLGASLATACCVPFAWLLTASLDSDPRWLRVVVVGVASAGAVATARTDGLWRATALTPALVAITAFAVYVAVPDTEEAAVLLGVSVPLALLGWPLRWAALGAAGAGATTALVTWTVATGARADPAAAVGALATLALLVGLSVGHRLGQEYRRTRSAPVPAVVLRRVAVVVGLVHAGLAGIAARVGAAGAGLSRAVPVAILVTVASACAGAVLTPAESERTDAQPE